MAVLGTGALTMADWATRVNQADRYKIAMIIEMLSQTDRKSVV